MNELDHIILDAKLKRFDQFAPAAVALIAAWMQEHPEGLIAIARGRHAAGHLRWGDKNWGEYGEDDLLAETGEELADAIVYIARMLWLQSTADA